MPKRKHAEIRKAIMEEVRIKDEAKNPPRINRHTVATKPKKLELQRKTKPHGLCCMEVMKDYMPQYFRPCPDCPLTEVVESR